MPQEPKSKYLLYLLGIDKPFVKCSNSGTDTLFLKAVCTEAGMYALRERRVHVTQEDFEMAVSKVMKKDSERNMSISKLFK